MKKIISIIIVSCLVFTSSFTGKVFAATNSVGVTYQSHVQNIGWQDPWANDGQVAGTEGKSLRMEAMKVNLTNAPTGASIKYEAHVAKLGWQSWVSDGQEAGTSGKSIQMEALKVSLVNMPGYSIEYQCHVEDIGWQSWVSDGQISGTTGKGLRLEAIRLRVVKISDNSNVTVQYQSHLKDIGWQTPVSNGQVAGTEGLGLRLEALKINLLNAPIGSKIRYEALINQIGWQGLVANGQLAGTEGKGLQTEAIRIYLENMPGYSVQYQVHVAHIGWQPWVNDGQIAGTIGMSLQLEAIRIRIVASLPVVKISLISAIVEANTNKGTAIVSKDGTDVLQANQWVTAAVMEAYISSITTAHMVDYNLAATQIEIDDAVALLTTATGIFKTAKKAGTQAAVKTVLNDEIIAANTNKTTVVVSTDGIDVLPTNQWVNAAAMTAYTDAITAAQLVSDNANATQVEVDDAVKLLTTATGTFNTAKADGIMTVQIVAETAVATYENAPITTLAEIATAEGLKVAADSAVAVSDTIAKTAFELRITNRATAIATAKTALVAVEAIADINNAPDAAAMSLAITTHAATIGLILTDYNALTDAGKVIVQTTMLSPTFTTIVQVKTTFDNAVLPQKALLAVNTASAATMGSVITLYSTALGLTSTTLSDYKLLTTESKDIVHAALEGKDFADNAAVNTAFATSVSVLIINEMAPSTPPLTASKKMVSTITRYRAILGLEAIPYDTYIAPSVNAVSFQYHVNTVLMAITMTSTADVKAAFTAAVTAEAVHSIDIQVFNYMERELKTYAVILGLDMTDYDALKNKDFVISEMVAQTFTTVAQVKTSFDSFVSQQKALEALTLLEAFNSAPDVATMGNVITIYQSLFKTADYNTYTNFIGTPAKTIIQTAMLSTTFTTVKDIQMAFVIGIVNNKYINYGKQVFINNAELFGLATSAVNNEFTSLPYAEQSPITSAVFGTIPVVDQTEIVVATFNSTITPDYIGTLLSINSGLLNLDLTNYNALTTANKKVVHEALIAATMTNIVDVQTAFNAAVASVQ